MDRDLALERRLLARSFSSPSEIEHAAQARYMNNEIGDPHLVLLPTAGAGAEGMGGGVTANPGAACLGRNVTIRPTAPRRRTARQQMKVYVKTTLAAQKRLVAKVQRAQRALLHIDVDKQVAALNIPRFSQYLPLHGLWKQYIRDLLFGDQRNPNLNMVLPKLSTADFNGCWLRVVEARDRNIVGLTGIVLYDSQHSFMLVAPQVEDAAHTVSPAQRVGGLKVVAKRGTMFAFDVDISADESVSFTILGSRFELRAVDRASKKFKSRAVEDLY